MRNYPADRKVRAVDTGAPIGHLLKSSG